MMLGDKKKVAALIIKGLAPSPEHKREGSKQDSTPPKYDHAEYPEGDDFKAQGVEAAMEKLIEAIHKKDAKMAVEAFMECMECSDGASMEYKGSYMGSEKED